jgi:23S rRNA pseudouridine1911/1915/1917 synthase
MTIKQAQVKEDTTLTKISKQMGVEKTLFFRSLAIGGIFVNGKRVKKHNLKLKKGDTVSICFGVEPPNVEFNKNMIVYEDDLFICLNKPAGIPTQGTRCFDINHLYYFAKKYVNGYVGLHHRLDTDTSGLVLFTKDKTVNKYISDLFKNKQIKKQYLAVVHGSLKNKITIETPIGKLTELDVTKFWINTKNAKEAVTEIEPIVCDNNYSLIKVFPKTGRTHQIRVHLTSIKHPVVGDSFYNKNEFFRNLRQLLHCSSLEFIHPVTKKTCKIEAPLFEDFKTFVGKYLKTAL